MRRLSAIVVCTGVLVAGVAGGFRLAVHGQAAPAAQAPAAQPAGPPPPDTAALRQQYEQWRKDFKTWGKWAPVGQESKGTTSLITPEKVQSALKLVKSGIVVSLAHAEPQEVAADVGAAGLFHRTTLGITDGGTTDNYQISFHGQTVAHIDSWCHFFENGQMYNGVTVQGNLNPEKGCIKGGIMNWKDGITTRAVLYDIAQLKGVDTVDPSMPIRRADLEAWEKKVRREDRPGRHPAALHRQVEAARRAGGDGTYPSRATTPTRFRGCTTACRHSSGTTSTSTGIRVRAGRACAIRFTSPSSTGWASTSSSASTSSRPCRRRGG